MPSILLIIYPFIRNVLSSLFILLILFILFLLYILYERQRTFRQLKHAFVEPPYGLPIVYWYPKLLWNSHHYHKNNPTSTRNTTSITTENEDDKSFSSSCSSSSSSVSSFYQQYISSSNITNVLPRMLRLNRMDTKNENHHSTTNEKINVNMNRNCISQYHMYGTVYGIHTSVIHVAHPIPIQQILVSSSSSSSSLVSSSSSTTTTTTTTTNTYKSPAYNHFHSFCGQGVFTTDGKDWSMKRHAVLQALLVVVTESTTTTTTTTTTTPFKKKRSFIDCLEWECNTTATRLIQTIQDRINTTTTSSSSSFNIVPLLQRATIGLIYRYITHDSDTNLFHHHPKDEDHHDTMATTQRTNANEHFLQQYLHAITNIRMNILAQSRSIWYMILPSWWWNRLMCGGGGGWFGMKNTLYYMEQTHLLPYIQQMAYFACANAQIHSPLYKLLQNPIYSTTNINTTNTNTNDKKSKHSDGDNNKHKDQFTFSKNIIDETITLLFAGQDTTAATLSWTLHLLTLYPQVQEQLYQEIYTTLTTQRLEDKDNNNNNKSNSDDKLDVDIENENTINRDTISIRKRDVTKMTYLDAVIKESMRLYPVAPFIVRNIGGTSSNVPTTKKQHSTNINNTTSINYNNITDHSMVFPKPLPKNTLACIWIYSLHRHPNYWSKPDEFIPERWLVNNNCPSTTTPTTSDDDTTTTKQDLGISTPCAYIPYAIGARNCLGQPMANIILRILLCRLIYKYEFLDERVVQLQQQQKDSNPILTYEQIKPLHKDMQAGFTILPLGGLELSVKLRH